MLRIRSLFAFALLACLLGIADELPAKDLLLAKDVGAARDSLWDEGHRYRQWIYEQNLVADGDAKLDPKIKLTAGGKLRSHGGQVYFYNDIAAAVRVARETGRPLAFHVFDHTCADCLFILPQLYRRPAVVAASRDFVNCYVELPRQAREASDSGLTASQLTVQFFLPGMRRLRVTDLSDEKTLLGSFAEMKAYCGKLSDAEKMAEPRRGIAPTQRGY
ncbi:hypothetical protein FJ251_12395 [bacterium]|nr:hypothetical protein [bacterium]